MVDVIITYSVTKQHFQNVSISKLYKKYTKLTTVGPTIILNIYNENLKM